MAISVLLLSVLISVGTSDSGSERGNSFLSEVEDPWSQAHDSILGILWEGGVYGGH